MNKDHLFSRWSINQSLGFIVGWALFAIVGHGLTGEHGVYLNTPSTIMHTLGLFGMTLVLLAFQDRVTLNVLHVSFLRLWWIYLPSIAIVFWVGYYKGNIRLHGFPVDVFSTFITIGLLNGIFLSRPRRLSGWPFYSVLSALCGIAVVLATYPWMAWVEKVKGLVGHILTVVWLGAFTGVPMAIVGGLLLQRSITTAKSQMPPDGK